MDSQPILEGRHCPACGEPLDSGWKICPACETPVGQPACPSCARAVKENWKVCPECGVRLVCRECGGRLPAEGSCPVCARGDAAEPSAREELIEPVTGMQFVFVPGGVYQMGDLFGDGWENELPVREVRVADFRIGRYPVTQGQWRRVMPGNPSRFQKGDDYPVEQVSWSDAVDFIRRLNSMALGGQVLDLPSEKEWEYAARSGGLKQLYAGGDDVEAVAWYSENSEGSTQPVGRKAPNGLGLCDMSGNVWEWCRDRHTPAADDRVIRGGSWNLDAWSARCSRRFGFSADYSGAGLGFRLVARLN